METIAIHSKTCRTEWNDRISWKGDPSLARHETLPRAHYELPLNVSRRKRQINLLNCAKEKSVTWDFNENLKKKYFRGTESSGQASCFPSLKFGRKAFIKSARGYWHVMRKERINIMELHRILFPTLRILLLNSQEHTLNVSLQLHWSETLQRITSKFKKNESRTLQQVFLVITVHTMKTTVGNINLNTHTYVASIIISRYFVYRQNTWTFKILGPLLLYNCNKISRASNWGSLPCKQMPHAEKE